MPPVPGEPPRRFVGRPEAVDQLRRREDEARSGRGGLTLLLGEVGVGKATLIELLKPECAAHGMIVLGGRAGGPDGAPLQILRDALASRPLGERPGGARAPAASSLAALVPSPSEGPVMIGFAGRPEAMPPAEPDGEPGILENLGRRSPESELPSSAQFQGTASRLRRLVERGPVVLFLEEIHRADPATFEFLEYLAPDLGRHPIWIVASSVPLAQADEAARARLERLRRELRAEEVPVRSLSPQELPDFVRSLELPKEPEPEQLARWHAQTDGNPLFLERLIRSSIGVPWPEAHEARPAEPGPAVPAASALSGLPAGAVLGHSFPFELLWAATGEDEEQLSEEVEALVGRGLLREGIDEGLEFVREGQRSEIYAGLSASRRRLLHRKAGEALEARGSADPATVYALAQHCYLGRIDDRAALYNRIASDLAVQQGSRTVARRHLERALEAHRRARPGDAQGELELLLDLAVQLDRLGELHEADRLLTEAFERPALAHAATTGQRALARLYRARLLTDQGRWAEADELTRELLASADVRAGPRMLLRAHRLRGELLYYRGEYAEALAHHDEALRIARRLRDDREVALETVRRANVLGMTRARIPEALAAYRLATEALIRLGDLGEAAYAQLFLGVVESQRGRLDDGIRELHKALTLAEEGHDPRRIGWARFNLADLERERGRLPVARAHLKRALETLERVGDRFGLLQVHIIAGKIALASDEVSAAEIELLEAYRIARELETPADELEVLLRLSEVAFRRGDPGAARRRMEEAERIGFARRPDLAEELAEAAARAREGDGASAGRT